MNTPEIVDLNLISGTLPELPTPMVPRDNILDTIDVILTDATIVTVDGEDAIGKTTVLTAFSRRHNTRAISLFLESTGHWKCDPELTLIEIGQQVQWLLEADPSPVGAEFSGRQLRRMLFELSRRARWNKLPYLFVIDGLAEVAAENPEGVEDLVDMLPVGIPGFKFVASPGLPTEFVSRFPHKPLHLVTFSLDEIVRYLGDLVEDRQALQELGQLCRGLPGNLAIVRRLLVSGSAIADLLGKAPSALQDLFDLEWDRIGSLETPERLFLAVLAIDRNHRSLGELKALAKLSDEQASKLFRRATFLRVDSSSDRCDFVSDHVRRYVADRLASEKSTVLDAIIQRLLNTSDSAVAMVQLPTYLAAGRRYEELLHFLSADHFEQLVGSTHSLSALRHSSKAGFEAAQSLGKEDEVVKFGLQVAALGEIASAAVGRTEIAAHLAMNDKAGALALAQAADLKEDRLQLLALVAEAGSTSGGAADESIIAEIRQLYSTVDPKTFGDRAFDLAADLLPTCPDIAVDLIEKVASSEGRSDALDWAFARVSVAAMVRARTSSGTSSSASVDALVNRIQDPRAQTASLRAALLFKHLSAGELIAQLDCIHNVSDKLRLLRTWVPAHREAPDAIEAAVWGLRTAIKSTEYLLDSRVARQLATALPYSQDTAQTREFIGLIDGQRTALEASGSSQEFARLQILLARGEAHINAEAARNRALEVYFYIAGATDLAIRAAGLARLKSALPEIDPDRKLEASEGFHSVLQADLQSCVAQLLNVTADHHSATRSVISALARRDFSEAVTIALRLNTELRRDQALLDAIRGAALARLDQTDPATVVTAVNNMVHSRLRSHAVTALIEALPHLSSSKRLQLAKLLLPLYVDVADPGERSHLFAKTYRSLCEAPRDDHCLEHLLTQLRRVWVSVDAGWRKVDAAFGIAEQLAPVDGKAAREFVDLAKTHREETRFESWRSSAACWYAAQLAIRAARGLMRLDTMTSEDVDSISGVIELFPSQTDRTVLWRDLALTYFFEGNPSAGRSVVQSRLLPILEEAKRSDAGLHQALTVSAAPALWWAHKATALERLAALPPNVRDGAYYEICYTVLDKLLVDDPRSIDPHKHDLDYDEAVDLIALIPLFRADAPILDIVKAIASTFSAKSNRARYKDEQRLDIAQRLRALCESELPRSAYITHDGYRIAALSETNKLLPNVKGDDWQKLMLSARTIPNMSDRAFVLSKVAAAMPPKLDGMRRACVAEAETIIDELPVMLEKLELYEKVVEETRAWDQPTAKRLLTKAIRMTWTSTSRSTEGAEQRLLDVAYRIDPEFASGLTALMDKDEARKSQRELHAREYRVYELKRKLTSGHAPTELNDVARAETADASWRQLRALNSGRVNPVRVADSLQWLPITAEMSIADAFPIFAWIVENAVRSRDVSDKGRSHVKRMFTAAIATAGLARRIAERTATDFRHTEFTSSEISAAGIVKAGERSKGLAILTKWLQATEPEYLKIVDPYFGLDEVEILKLVQSVVPGCRIHVLTSRKHQNDTAVSVPWEQTYRERWRSVSDQLAPDVDVAVVGLEPSGKSPIHQRWVLTKSAGLELGTSFNALGFDQDTNIKTLSKSDAEAYERNVDAVLMRTVRSQEGRKISLTSFSL